MARRLHPGTVRWDGLEELRQRLRDLPADLRDDAQDIVLGAARAAFDDADRIYAQHVVTEDLRGGLALRESAASAFGVGAVVINRAKHAWIFEHGTVARKYITVHGKEKKVGAMPAFHAFIPSMVKRRREMYDRLKDMLGRHGLIATGDENSFAIGGR